MFKGSTTTMANIKEFQGQYRWLSNFWRCQVTYDGIVYPSSEHAYQAAKTLDVETRHKIAAAETPGIAKRMGKLVPCRPNWDSIKLQIMEDILRIKFSNSQLRQKLIDTGDKILEEGNSWGDSFWGICRGVGQNHLGKLLMKIRSDLCQS